MGLLKDNSLVGYWPLDGNALDYNNSATKNNGAVTGAVPTVSGNNFIPASLAYKLNGSSDFIGITDNSVLKPAGNFTVMAWVKTSAAGNQLVFHSGSQNTAVAGFICSVDTSIYFQLGKNTGTSDPTDYHNTIGTKAVNDGKWHFLVWVLSSNTVYLYIDGKLETSYTYSYAQAYPSTNYVEIGRLQYATSSYTSYFNGNIAEVALFSRAFSAKEIAQYYAWATGIKKIGIAQYADIVSSLIKKAAGVPYASIKKIGGVAIASVKKFIGLT